MTVTAPQASPDHRRLQVLGAVEQRVLWLATAIVHHANRLRTDPPGSRSAATRPPARR